MVFGINNLIGNVLGGFGASSGSKAYPKTLQASDFATSASTVITSDYTKVGQYTIPAQQKINVGYGSASQPENQGYIYVSSKNETGASAEGMIRIVVANANETKSVKVFEERTDVLSGSATLKTQKVPLPEMEIASKFGRIPQEDDRIQLWFKADTAGTLGASGWSPTLSTVYVPVSVYQ